jgi:hypothetical protein
MIRRGQSYSRVTKHPKTGGPGVLECCKTAKKQITLLVPGTRLDDVANIDVLGSWWILKEIPL